MKVKLMFQYDDEWYEYGTYRLPEDLRAFTEACAFNGKRYPIKSELVEKGEQT